MSNLENHVVSPSGRSLRGGGYDAIHKWLSKNFGKADKCESTSCDGMSTKFQYALIKGKKYEHKRENFIKLCSKCHFNYDVTPERRLKQANALKGRITPLDTRRKIRDWSLDNIATPIIQMGLDGKEIAIFRGIREASREVGVNPSGIHAVLKGRYKHCGGFLWKKV